MKTFPLSIVLVCCLALSHAVVFGFPENLDFESESLKKSGESRVKALGFISLFEAALYLEEDFQPTDFPGDFGYGLKIRYQRKFKKEALIDTANTILQDLHTDEDLSSIQETIEEINRYYVDVEKGDIYTLVYQPEKGTTLLFNGEPKVTLGDQAFAEIYFSIWLGGHPKCRQLKEDLLES